jgi:hypothetical protein
MYGACSAPGSRNLSIHWAARAGRLRLEKPASPAHISTTPPQHNNNRGVESDTDLREHLKFLEHAESPRLMNSALEQSAPNEAATCCHRHDRSWPGPARAGPFLPLLWYRRCSRWLP